MRLYTVFGNLLSQQEINAKKGWNKNRFDFVKDLPTGTYIFSITDNKTVINKKIIKM
jgi:hypothetical protein